MPPSNGVEHSHTAVFPPQIFICFGIPGHENPVASVFAAQFNADNTRNTGFGHGDADQAIGMLHGDFVV